MRPWLRGKPAGLFGFAAVAVLVAGGLGWATTEALRLEREQLAQQVESEYASQMRLALWRLDSRIWPLLAREDSRPFNHYSAVSPIPLALNNSGACWPTGAVLEPSPLLSDEFPSWMLLHFQTARGSGWESPQVLSPRLDRQLQSLRGKLALTNITPQRRKLLDELKQDLPVALLLRQAGASTQPATGRDTTVIMTRNDKDNSLHSAAQNADIPGQQMVQGANQGFPNLSQLPEYNTRRDQQARLYGEGKTPQRIAKDLALNTLPANGANWLTPNLAPRASKVEVLVHRSPMVPVWLETATGPEQLVLLRLVSIEETEICQGIVLDVPALRTMLAEAVADLFPDAKLTPMRESSPPQPERTMTALPFQLDPGGWDRRLAGLPSDPGWTPLRIGLALAWLAALLALGAVGLGGWSLLDLSERRIRFVSAVTHELRTPLTTLRLYLDMLVNDLVREEKRDEYLHTLHAETERLHRLVGNVLDFSRLEKQRPRLNRSQVAIGELLEQVRATWASRCQDAEKELIIENRLPEDAALETDRELMQQVLGNLIDNACKYSQGAEDRRLWLRARREGRRLIFEIEDRGPGVAMKDRRSIFRVFRRGRGADETAGGVGLGLALARRWARLLGGRLTLQSGAAECGACFRVELPLAA
jgi:signal transduction histidine kinase